MVSVAPVQYDVIIIGGGPGGSTTGALLRKYDPNLRVLIVEREKFPRDHVGESQLPPIGAILREMGCWEEVEAANFPLKMGVTYTWGRTTDPWVFGFMPDSAVPAKPERPAKFEGWRTMIPFQVDRAVYDTILLGCAERHGCEVRQETKVKAIHRTGDRIDGIELADGQHISAKYYIDASGNAAVVRRAMGVKCEVPTLLKNVAFWDYWEKPAWTSDADPRFTRIHIRSLGFGWIWSIRISQTRTSVGVVCNAEYYKKSGKKPEELYREALASEPFVSKHLKEATTRGHVEATNDWSFVVDRTYGENWFLVGECAGFADPILSAGLTLTQSGGRELAYTILELERAEHKREWLVQRYDELQKRRVRQHMRFAEFWYAANGMFDEIKENCSAIAKEAGLTMNATEAFRWLSFGGLGDDVPGQVGIGGLDGAGAMQVLSRFTDTKAEWAISGRNVFKLNFAGATESTIGMPDAGCIRAVKCWRRGGKVLAEHGVQAVVIAALQQSPTAEDFMAYMNQIDGSGTLLNQASQVLELMVADFWVMSTTKSGRPALSMSTRQEGARIYTDTSGKL